MKGWGVTQVASEVVLDSLNEGVVTIGLDKRIKYLNRAAEQLLGYTLKEARNMPCAAVVDCTACRNNCLLDQLLSTGRPITHYESILENRHGQAVTISTNATLLRGPGGRVIGGVEVIRDRLPIQDDFVDRALECEKPLEAIERRLVLRALSQTGWSYKETAERLKISRTTLWRKMKEFRIDHPASKTSNGR